MDYAQFIQDGSLIMVAVLYVLGMMIKGIDNEYVNDKYIPFILLIVGELLSIFGSGLSVDSIMQGVIITGTAVYSNQLIKQVGK